MNKYLFLLIIASVFISQKAIAQIQIKGYNNGKFQYERNSRQRTYQELEKNLQKKRQEERQRYNSNSNQFSNSASVKNIDQSNEKVISLVSNGTGKTKEEAIQNALRSAIEQTYGTFVSANTEVLNDELIKDDIVTVSSGNVKSYKELSVNQSDELYDVSVQVTISIDHLTQFAQSRGMQAELAGASFIMNMKMKELNKKNEAASIEHMIEKARAIAKNGLFDYLLEIGEPRRNNNSKYSISIKILFCENSNTIAFYKTIYDTFKALSLTKTEINDYKKANIPYYVYDIQLKLQTSFGCFALRNKYENTKSEDTWLMPMYMKELQNYILKDNLGNKWVGNSEAHPVDANIVGSSSFHFKPDEDTFWMYRGKRVVVRDNKRIYYVQKFSIEYTEEELSKLSSITIDHNKD